jgi:hypothetical protein
VAHIKYTPLIIHLSMVHIEYAPCIYGGSHPLEKVADLSVAHGQRGMDSAAHGHVVPRFKPQEIKSQGVGRQLVALRQPPAGSVLEPACPEMAGDTPWSSTSRLTTVQPEERSWDLDGHKLTSARNRTHRSPMLSHETLPVLGASVVGMTIWVGQGQSHLPADVPGITATPSRGGRLQLKGRQRQQTTSAFITGGPSQ